MPQRATATDFFSLPSKGYGLVEYPPGRPHLRPRPRAVSVTGPDREWSASMGSPVTPGSVSTTLVDDSAGNPGGRP